MLNGILGGGFGVLWGLAEVDKEDQNAQSDHSKKEQKPPDDTQTEYRKYRDVL